MDSSNGKASNFERRSSIRRSMGLSTTHGATDEDDYDLSAMMVADGFRPSDQASSSSATSSSSQQRTENYTHYTPSTPPSLAPQLPPIGTPLQPLGFSLDASPVQKSDMRNRPSSISKPPRSHDSLALRNEGTSASAAGQSRIGRVSSMSSDAPVMRIESPYQGPSGPSHPYQMYPQRTMSVATTSTTAAAAAAIIPEDRSYTGPRGPTHPYTLYPQNTVPTGESSTEPIPVGFNGMGGNYQRQIGPDGEEAGDMIGPLGHLEELPPYTRYAENAFVPKPTSPAVSPEATETTVLANVAPAAEPASPSRSIPGAGGIGRATRDPEFSSIEDDIGMPRTRPSMRSNASDVSRHEVNTAARDVAEKPTVNKWQRRAKKKLWGIVPYWAICLLTVGLVLMGIIMGAVIGTLLTRHKKPPYDEESASATSGIQTYDAVPTGLSLISTGHYGLPPFDTSQQPSSCLNDSTQSVSWSCDIKFSYYSMDVTKNADADDFEAYQIVMKAINATKAQFIWGAQAPSITNPVTLKLVNDTYELGRGPAWWATMEYNKTVIVQEDKLHTISNSKRGWDEGDDEEDGDDNGGHFPPPPGFKQSKSFYAKDGDKPWICTWPGVQLGIFIYPNQNTSNTFSSSTTAESTATATTTGAEASTTSSSRFGNAPPSYPKVLKMVEQRYWTKDRTATCRQVKVINNGKTSEPVCDSDGNPIEISLVESSSLGSSKFRPVPKRWHVRDMLSRGTGLELTDCGCLWWSL